MATRAGVTQAPEATRASRAPAGASVHVVVGPRTRLGGALVRLLAGGGEQVLLVARGDADRAALAGGPGTVVPVAEVAETVAGLDPHVLHVHVCALGPVHPTTPDLGHDTAAAHRDLDALAELLRRVPAERIRIVLVSTVLALAPGTDRRYYGGWKCLLEQQLRELVAARPGAALSVLYPGRLVTDAEIRRPWHRTHSRYRRLAELVRRAAVEGPVSRVVGLDARIWLVLRGARLALGAVHLGTPGPAPVHPSPPVPDTVSQEISS